MGELNSKTLNKKVSAGVFAKQNVVLICAIILFISFSIFANGFLSVRNIFVILRSMSIIAVLGLGLTMVLTVGEIDLSIQNIPALSACLVPFLLPMGVHPAVIVLIALGIALGFGVLNGLIIVKTGLPGIIVTMATSMVAGGIAYIISNQTTNIVTNQGFLDFFGGTWGSFPVMAVWMIVALVISFVLLHKTKFGRNVAFTGENKTAAFFSGIKITRVYIAVFGLCALFSCLAGMLGIGLASNASPMMITGDMMTAIAAAIIGGTSLSGGHGNIIGTIIGAFFLTMISNGFMIMGIEQWVLYLVNGLTIIAVLTLRYVGKQKK